MSLEILEILEILDLRISRLSPEPGISVFDRLSNRSKYTSRSKVTLPLRDLGVCSEHVLSKSSQSDTFGGNLINFAEGV